MVTAPTAGEKVAIEHGDQLLAPCSRTVERIRHFSGHSATQWDAAYQPLLVRWAAYLQRLPDLESTEMTLLEHRLRQTERLLARRQGVILPLGADPERVSREADLWTYVVFSLGLLRRLGAALAPLAVAVWSPQDRPLGRWRPDLHPRGLASVKQAAAYSVFPNTATSSAEWTLLVVGALLPDAGRNLLWRESTVFTVWKQALIAPVLPTSIRALFSMASALEGDRFENS